MYLHTGSGIALVDRRVARLAFSKINQLSGEVWSSYSIIQVRSFTQDLGATPLWQARLLASHSLGGNVSSSCFSPFSAAALACTFFREQGAQRGARRGKVGGANRGA